MGGLEVFFGVVLLLFSIAVVVITLLQESRQRNLGTVIGGVDTFLPKNKARPIDTFLPRWTKVIAVGFFVMVIIINAVMLFTGK